MGKSHSKVLVVLSGGQDSTTALAWAKSQFGEVHALTFNYGQRHAVEVESAKTVASMLKVDGHEVINIPDILKGTSPLVDPSRKVEQYSSPADMPGGIEPTFVPARNLLFLTIAANRATVMGINTIIIGVSQADYGGYPDCRQTFLVAAEKAIAQALVGRDIGFNIVAPLIGLTKAETVMLAKELHGAWEALAYTHTCYDGQYPPDPFNHASMLRARGFKEAGLPDPLIQRAISEGKLPTDYPQDGYAPGTKYDRTIHIHGGKQIVANGAGTAIEEVRDLPSTDHSVE